MKKVSIIEMKAIIRATRERECFPVINRGRLWYNTLTVEQLSELKQWYFAWLNAPETLVIPKTPEWLKNKVIEEDII